MRREKPRNDLSYEAALHAMQAGVAAEMGLNNATEPKHLRVGINSSMVEHTALVRLLIKKGLTTWEEFSEELRLEMNREVDDYEDRLREQLGPNITLR